MSQCSGASSSAGVWGVFSRHVGENIQTLSHLTLTSVWHFKCSRKELLKIMLQQEMLPEISPVLPTHNHFPLNSFNHLPTTAAPTTHNVQQSPSCMHLQTSTCSLFLRRNRLQFWLENLPMWSLDLRHRNGAARFLG